MLRKKKDGRKVYRFGLMKIALGVVIDHTPHLNSCSKYFGTLGGCANLSFTASET